MVARSPFLRYGIAVSVVALALLLKLLLDPLIVQETPFLLVLGAVMIAAWLGGLGPGLLATAIAALVINYFFLPPFYSFAGPEELGKAVPLALFVLEGALASAIVAALGSARRRAETSALETQRYREERQRTEERFRLLVEGVKDYAIFMLDPDGYVVSWNAGAERITRYTAEEIIGEHFSRFYTEEDFGRGHPDEELRVAANEGRYEEEGLRVRKDGSRFWANTVITALRDEEGNLRGFSKVVRDITERKLVEQDLRGALDRLLAVYEAGRVFGSSLKREEIGSGLLETMQRVSDLSAAVIELQDGRGQWRVLCTTGQEKLWRWARSTPEAQSARHVALESEEHGAFELRPSGPNDARLWGVCLPLRVRERLLGVLEAYGSQTLVERETVETLASLAGQAASALENARLYEELAERERRLRDLVDQVFTAQEEERRRVAYEVHDGLAQVAAAAHQHLRVFARRHPPDSARGQKELGRALELIQQTVKEARRVIADLRPTVLDDLGLAAAIRLQAEDFRTEDCQISYEETLGNKRLPSEVETALYRVAQEALTNALKHAQSSHLHIRLERFDRTVRLEVRDWGRGFEPSAVTDGGGPGERMGLSSMEERVGLLGGNLEIHSEPGAGTSVVAEVPLSSKEETDGER